VIPLVRASFTYSYKALRTQRLVTEIEMLKVVLYLVSRGEEVEKREGKEKAG
jgi:hypothetical protein